jgi:hypothetical protein
MGVQGEQAPVPPVAREGQPLGVLDHPIELVPVGHQVALAVGRLVDGVAGHHHPAEMHAAEVADAVVVIAGDVDHRDALARQPQHLLHHVVMRLWPEPAGLHLPAVDDIAHQVERVALQHPDELQQPLGLATLGPQVHVGDKGGAAAQGRRRHDEVPPTGPVRR